MPKVPFEFQDLESAIKRLEARRDLPTAFVQAAANFYNTLLMKPETHCALDPSSAGFAVQRRIRDLEHQLERAQTEIEAAVSSKDLTALSSCTSKFLQRSKASDDWKKAGLLLICIADKLA